MHNKTVPKSESHKVKLTTPIEDTDDIIRVRLSAQVDSTQKWLCKNEPQNEWFAILFYSITEGDLTMNVEKALIDVTYLHLMDIGSGASTSIENHDDLLDLFDIMPELEDLKQGVMHSHNTMGVFFSGTDNQQLIDGARDFDVFLSLITNNANDMIGKISFPGKVHHVQSFLGMDVTDERDVAFNHSCKILRPEEEIDDLQEKRYAEIQESKTPTYWNPYGAKKTNGFVHHQAVDELTSDLFGDTYGDIYSGDTPYAYFTDDRHQWDKVLAENITPLKAMMDAHLPPVFTNKCAENIMTIMYNLSMVSHGFGPKISHPATFSQAVNRMEYFLQMMNHKRRTLYSGQSKAALITKLSQRQDILAMDMLSLVEASGFIAYIYNYCVEHKTTQTNLTNEIRAFMETFGDQVWKTAIENNKMI